MLRVAAFLRRLLIRYTARMRAIKARAPKVEATAIAVLFCLSLSSASEFSVAVEVLEDLVEVAVLDAVLSALMTGVEHLSRHISARNSPLTLSEVALAPASS